MSYQYPVTQLGPEGTNETESRRFDPKVVMKEGTIGDGLHYSKVRDKLDCLDCAFYTPVIA